MAKESQIEKYFVEKLKELKYIYRSDIVDRETLEKNFRKNLKH